MALSEPSNLTVSLALIFTFPPFPFPPTLANRAAPLVTSRALVLMLMFPPFPTATLSSAEEKPI